MFSIRRQTAASFSRRRRSRYRTCRSLLRIRDTLRRGEDLLCELFIGENSQKGRVICFGYTLCAGTLSTSVTSRRRQNTLGIVSLKTGAFFAYLFRFAFRSSPTLGKAAERGTFASCDRNLRRFCTSAAAVAVITMVIVEFVVKPNRNHDYRLQRLPKDGAYRIKVYPKRPPVTWSRNGTKLAPPETLRSMMNHRSLNLPLRPNVHCSPVLLVVAVIGSGFDLVAHLPLLGITTTS